MLSQSLFGSFTIEYDQLPRTYSSGSDVLHVLVVRVRVALLHHQVQPVPDLAPQPRMHPVELVRVRVRVRGRGRGRG